MKFLKVSNLILIAFQVCGSEMSTRVDPHVYTALPIAAARAVATDRKAGVVDPLAYKLVAGENKLIQEGANVEYMTLRALIGDDLVLERHSKGVRQVVSLGAGMDSRAFRLGLQDTVFFEVDKENLFEIKEPLVKDNALQALDRKLVKGTIGQFDLKSALLAAGFDKTKPTTWLMEGLTPYLTVPVMKDLASNIGELSAVGSGLWLDGFSKTSVDGGMYFHGVKFESGFDDYDELFKRNGFDQAFAMDMSGVNYDKMNQKLRFDNSFKLTPASTRGYRVCLMAKAIKTK